MLRLWFIVIVSLPSIFSFVFISWVIRVFRKILSEKFCYRIAKKTLLKIMKRGRISTEVIGKENLPAEGGYVMYSNHQGKYDAVGIIYGHESPCTILMDKKRSKLPIMKEFLTIIRGKGLDSSNIKKQIATINKVADEVKAGRKYIVFPEGGYNHNHNNISDFKPGAFKIATKSKSPIVPVVVIDSYKPFEINSLAPVKTKVVFLEPFYYEDYKGMTSIQIAQIVHDRVVEGMKKYSGTSQN